MGIENDNFGRQGRNRFSGVRTMFDVSRENIMAIERRVASGTPVKVVGCPYLIGEDCFNNETECMTKYKECSIYQSRNNGGRIL